MKQRLIYLTTYLTIFLICLLCSANAYEEPFSVELVVQELLIDRSSGIDRIDEPVIFGVPIPDSAHIKEEADGTLPLGLKGTTRGQFRTLLRWPSGNVKWALVAFTQNVKARKKSKGVYLTRGKGNFGGSNIANEFPDKIIIDTGPLKGVILKRGFNIFDEITVEGEKLISSGSSSGIVLVDRDGKEYTSLAGDVTDVHIEDNGPVFCVIRIDGNLKDKESNWMTDYTVRIRAYAGKSYIKMQYVLRNANASPLDSTCPPSTNYCMHLKIRGINHSIKLDLNEPVVAQFSKHLGSLTIHLDKDKEDEAYIYQAVTNKKIDYSNGEWASPIPYDKGLSGHLELFKEKGYKIGYGNHELFNLMIEDTTSYPSWKSPEIVWMDLKGKDGRGCLVAIAQSRWLWPVGLSGQNNGIIKVGTHTTLNKNGYTITWRTHETREILFYFHKDALNDPNAAALSFEYPLVGRVADFEYYDKCRVFHTRLVSPEVHLDFMYKNGYNRKEAEYLLHKDLEDFSITRHKWPNAGGYENNHDGDWDMIIRFFRLGHTTAYFSALAETRYRIDFANPHHEDGLIYIPGESDPTRAPYWVVYTLRGSVKNDTDLHSSSLFSNIYHPMIARMYIAYLATGEERFKDGLLEHADYIFNASARQIRAYMLFPGKSDTRAIARGGIEMLIFAWDILKFATPYEYPHYKRMVSQDEIPEMMLKDLKSYEKSNLYFFLKEFINNWFYSKFDKLPKDTGDEPFRCGWDMEKPGEASLPGSKGRGFFIAPWDNGKKGLPAINSLYFSTIVPEVLSIIYHFIPDENIKRDALLRMRDMAKFSKEYFRFLDQSDRNLRRPVYLYKIVTLVSPSELIPTYPLPQGIPDPNMPTDSDDSDSILSCCLFDSIQQYTSNSFRTTKDPLHIRRLLAGLDRAWNIGNRTEYKIWQHLPEFMDFIYLYFHRDE